MPWTLPRRVPALRPPRGFTLLELLIAAAIAAILGSLSVASYRGYIIRARTAQTLVNIDHIRSVLAVELASGSPGDMETDAVPGRAPPSFGGALSDREFIGVSGHPLWFFRAPAGTFASFPDREVYALLASASTAEQQQALYALRWGLPFRDGDEPWLSVDSFAFPLESPSGGGGSTPGPGPGPGPGPDPTQPPDCSIGSRFGGLRVEGTCGSTWSSHAQLAACNAAGQPLNDVTGQVQILRTETVRAWNGEYVQYAWTTWGDWHDGIVTFQEAALRPETLSVRYDVLGVNYYYPSQPPVRWDGLMPSVTIDAPCAP